MKSSNHLLDELQWDTLIHEHISSRSQLRSLKVRREYRFFLRAFHRWWIDQGAPLLTQEVLLAWMLQGVEKSAVQTTVPKVLALNQFFDFLVFKNLLLANPLLELREGYRLRGYRGILRDLQRTGSVSEVVAMAEHPFSGPLGRDFLFYLKFMKSFGKQGANCGLHLQAFEKFLRGQKVTSWEEVNRPLVDTWIQECNPPSAHQRRCLLLILKDFFLYQENQGVLKCSPVPPPGPPCRRSLPPYVFSREEITSILKEALALPDHRLMPYRGQEYWMCFLTLYALGLRKSEALNLRLKDIDFTQHCLAIVQTKFYKGRVLPFGPRYEAALKNYLNQHPMLRTSGADAFLFPSDSGRTQHLAGDTVFRALKKILGRLGITSPAQIRNPNLHSFRHSFAVHRVEQWHREGANLEEKLPLLSAFLGHVDPASTQVYLSMTPERLDLINRRFEASVAGGAP